MTNLQLSGNASYGDLFLCVVYRELEKLDRILPANCSVHVHIHRDQDQKTDVVMQAKHLRNDLVAKKSSLDPFEAFNQVKDQMVKLIRQQKAKRHIDTKYTAKKLAYS